MPLDPAALADAIRVETATLLRERESGGAEYQARCRVPFFFDSVGPFGARQTEADEEEAAEEADPTEGILEGIASSTSVDWYGTEMTRQALEGMAEQMRAGAGVSYVPAHRRAEWDEEIGRTIDATVEAVDEVAEPAEASERQYVLRALVQLDMEEELARKLWRKVREQQRKIGQSIGGWFTEMRFLTDEKGNVERVLIEGVELDHLAATRSPANPDSWIDLLRSALAESCPQVRDRSLAVQEPAEDPGEEPPELEGQPVPGDTEMEADLADTAPPEPDTTLDSATAAGQHAEEEAPGDRSVGHPDNPEEESDMDPQEIAQLLRAELEPVTQRLEALEARQVEPEPQPAVAEIDDSELREAQAEIERLKEANTKLRAKDARRGVRFRGLMAGGTRAKPAIKQLRQRAANEGNASNIIDLFDACGEDGPEVLLTNDPMDSGVSAGDLVDALRSVCMAAEDDGLVRDPSNPLAANWA